MAWSFSKRSLSKLNGVHPHLRRLTTRALSHSEVDFGVIEGARTAKRQKQLFDAGASQRDGVRKKSRHQRDHKGLFYAVDVAAYIGRRISWDWPLYYKIKEAYDEASLELDIPFEWGGDWLSLRDGPHFQLPWDLYPPIEPPC